MTTKSDQAQYEPYGRLEKMGWSFGFCTYKWGAH